MNRRRWKELQSLPNYALERASKGHLIRPKQLSGYTGHIQKTAVLPSEAKAVLAHRRRRK